MPASKHPNRAIGPTVKVVVRVPPELWAQVCACAESGQVSRNTAVVEALRQWTQ